MSVTAPQVRRSLAAITLVLWLASLALPAALMTFNGGATVVSFSGFQMLSTGYFGLLWLQPSWLANFAILSVVLGLTSNAFSQRFLAIMGIASIILALFSIDMIVRRSFYGLIALKSGYFLWLAAALVAFASAFSVSKSLAAEVSGP